MRKEEFYYGEGELQQKNIPMNRVIDKIEEKAKHQEEKQFMREQKKLRRQHGDAEEGADEAPMDEEDSDQVVDDVDDDSDQNRRALPSIQDPKLW